MSPASDETRAKVKDLVARCKAAHDAAEPQRQAYEKAMEPYVELAEQLAEATGGALFDQCANCGELIMVGDQAAPTDDGWFCLQCAPRYEQLVQYAEHFLGDDDAPLTVEEAQQICDAHVTAGGSLKDKRTVEYEG